MKHDSHLSPLLQRSLFRTTDCDLAAYLYARAYPLIAVEEQLPGFRFTFPSDAELSATGYYDEASISAKSLLHAARHIQQLMTNRELQQKYA